MNVGIVGSGKIGVAVGALLARAGHSVLFSFSRDAEKLKRAAGTLGENARAGTPEEAVAFGEVVLFAPPWRVVDEAISAAGGPAAFRGKILIDTTNPFSPEPDVPDDSSGGEQIARRLPAAKVVKAYNTLPASTLVAEADPTNSERLTLFYCGDEPEAKEVVAGLISDSGFEPVVAGPLRNARHQEPKGPFFNRPMGAETAYEALSGAVTPGGTES